MSLQIHRAERADRLAEELGEILSIPLPDPFATEIIAVPTPGVERWLAQTLSHRLGTSPAGRDGVCAGVDFPTPRRLTAAAVSTVLGLDPRSDPWLPRRAVWPLLGVLEQARGESWAGLLWAYLGDAPQGEPREPDPIRQGRRWSTAAHLAELFATYAANRPQMLLSWRNGCDVDASGNPLAPEFAWQAELWRRLRTQLDEPSPAERTAVACAQLVSAADRVDLPARVSVFGVTRLAPEDQAVLRALAVHRDVHLWLTHASPGLWGRLASRSVAGTGRGPRSADPTADLPRHPLLAYLGRDLRELQLILGSSAGDAPGSVPSGPEAPGPAGPRPVASEALNSRVADVHHGAAEGLPTTLLEMLQQDLARDCPVRAPADRPVLMSADTSIAVHSSHGPDRQVEVLREVLVGLLADDPTLEPRDIVVMCPDIERFAPLVSASFGLDSDADPVEHPGHRLRVRLADRSLRQRNPLLATLSRVLELAGSRFEASALLDLCALPPVMHKFGFTEDELERLRDLVLRSGVRWGLDVEQRRSFAMGGFAQNTWAAGLDRLLLGVTMDELGQHFLGTALPLDDVDSSDVDLVGRLAELLDRLRTLMLALDTARPVSEWVAVCQTAIDQLTSVSSADGWQPAHAYTELGRLTQLADDDRRPERSDTELSLTELRALLADTFRGRATRANFRTGTLTMCTMMPMRSVPHRVICLLGVDDGVFPRHSSRDGDDILAAEPWVGDRDPRSEDRQLLLDAIMAARERLVIVYCGADPRTRVTQPPSVPIGALLDALDVTARAQDGASVRDQITTRHPLQPFDPSNFAAGRRSFSFDRSSLRGAVAAAGPRTVPSSRFAVSSLSAPPLPDLIGLADLVRFFLHPAKAFLRARAELYLGRSEEEQPDEIPVRLDGLQAWKIGDRLLKLHLEGMGLEQLRAAEWRRGQLPPQRLGSRALEPVLDNVSQLAEAARPFLTAERRGVDVLAEVGGRSVFGTLSSVYGDRLVTVSYSRLAPKHRLQAWIELLALTVSHPEWSWQTLTIGRGGRSLLGPVPAVWAGKVLADLLDLYASGLAEPLPFEPRTAAEYARFRREGKSVANYRDKLEQLWNEERDPSYEKLFGTAVTWEELVAVPSRAEEERGHLSEPSRVGTLARRVWHLLLESEVLS